MTMDFTNETLTDLSGQDFEDSTFKECTLIETNAREAKLIECTFEHSTFSSVAIDGAVLQVRFIASKVEGINFFLAKRDLLSVSFENCLVRYSSFAELRLKKLTMTGCTL